MSTEIPLKIRVGIRDQWESPRAPIRHSIDALERILGHAITPQVDWPKVYSSLKDTFSEPSTFVPAIYRITIAFYGRLLSALEKESNKEWKETFLEKMAKIMNWRLYIEVPMGDDSTFQRPKLIWNVDAGSFCIHVPKRKPAGNAIIEAGFDEDLKYLFRSSPSLASTDSAASSTSSTSTVMTASLTAASPSKTTTDKPMLDFTNTEEGRNFVPQKLNVSKEQLRRDTSPPTKPFLSDAMHEQREVATKAADLVTRPSKLFRHISPYILVVDAEKVPLRIQCSHQPSLEHIASYLRKWARVDQNSLLRQPLLKIEMVESTFFSGVFDGIVIEPMYSRGDPQPLNPTLVLGLVEGVLGYQEAFTNGTRWTFKRYPEGVSKESLHDRNQKLQMS